ncbi:MAG: phosphotriesterase [Bryobacteraceae bacterium]
MTRRRFCAALAAPLAVPQGSILVHEHVLVDFGGTGRYDAGEVFRAARPKLEQVRNLGCRRLQDCTPNFLGRDPRLLARLADAVGMEIWTNTGLYGAASHKYLPPYARDRSAAELARDWIAEAAGIDGVKPRFIKIGVNRAPLPELDRKLIRAAAIASRETGLTIASHTGDGLAAVEQLEIVGEESAPLNRFVWVHAHNEKDHSFHERVARAGAWVEFDGVNAKSAAWHRESVRFMAGRGLLGRTLVSQDSGWYRVGEPGGGDFRPYTYIYTDFLPGLDAAWVKTLMLTNPVEAFG